MTETLTPVPYERNMPIPVVNFEEYAMSCSSVVQQVQIIQNVMHEVMKENEHFGIIPGTNKPSLYKSGAEKLSLTFRLRPEYEIRRSDLLNDHREYEVVCTLYHIPTGQSVGQGVGAATTMEGKYRYRGGEKESTGQSVPKEYWNLKNAGKLNEAQALIGGEGYLPGKIDGVWQICSIGAKVEHDNPADYYNTVLKMAKKRAHVDAILTATAASDIFTQDVEDMPEVIPGAKEVPKSEAKPPLKEPQKKAETAKASAEAMADILIVETAITDTKILKEGESKGKPYKLYGITGDNNTIFRTFSDSIAESAKNAQIFNQKVKIFYTTGQYGNIITEMEVLDGREPGSEG